MIHRLDNPVRRYAWGSVDAIPRLLGVPPDGEPQAELWLGAHERAASRVRCADGVLSLHDLIRADPRGELGAEWAEGERMPFLAKVIATAQPLSLQVHPDAERAVRWYAEEEARGVDRDGPTRSCPDDVAKAEMVWALSEFRALCGFRPCEDAVHWLRALGVPALGPTADALAERGRACLRTEVVRLLQMPAPATVLAAVHARSQALVADPRWSESARVITELVARYPADPAVLMALLLRPLVLAPGDAMFVRPGQPHCYLSGLAFEVQANSDNVVRAGLTRKHVDVDLLVDALDTLGAGVAAIPGLSHGDEQVFAPDTGRFALAVLRGARGAQPLERVPGPQVFFCTEGDFRLQAGDALDLRAGQSAYVPAREDDVRVHGQGTLLRVTTGRAGARTSLPARPAGVRDAPAP